MIIDTGATCSLVAKKYLGIRFPMWHSGLLPTEFRDSRSATGRMDSLGIIQADLEIPHSHRNVNIYPKFSLLENAGISEFFLGTDYKTMYVISIHKSSSTQITLGDSKDRELSISSNRRRELMTKHLIGLKHKPPDRESMSTRKVLAQGNIDQTRPSTLQREGKSHQ
ncbi:hypothetical protein O181_127925 [Austropuccinia psidii MF-1]|uniref:Uncharacterized protein n=1 Tax=Austropuccinia psidii MF-1 TaxID=1389203 RepID=A0A9Q3KU52_9BASI|nr:hypothetical protein [Austropuccinia psidii MF-1]